MSIGNLMIAAGFEVLESKPLYDTWAVNRWRSTLVKLLGWKGYHLLGRIFGRFGPLFQIRVIAKK